MNLFIPPVANMSPQFIVSRLFSCIAFLLTCSILVDALKFVFHIEFNGSNFLIFLFSVNYERNIPTFFSVLLLLFATRQLYNISFEKSILKEPYRYHWWLMTIIFFLIAADEFMATHEMLSELIRDKYQLGGVLYYSWVIPFGIILCLLVISYARFIFRYLPSRIRNLMIMSAIIYIGGSMIIEMLGAYVHFYNGAEDMTYILLTNVEEGMEMCGIVVFIYTLALYNEKPLHQRDNLNVKENQQVMATPDQ